MILLAAGRGTRFGGETPKVYLPCAGRPVLLHSAARLGRVAELERGSELLLVAHAEDRTRHLAPLLPELTRLGCRRIVDGGATRQESMARGLAAADPATDLILIHDAARPLFAVAAAQQALRVAAEVGAALLAAPLADTLKQVDGDARVQRTVDRAGLWCAQTPQVVRRDLLQTALQRAAAAGHQATDDVGLVEWIGGTVQVVPSDATNLKITRPQDLAVAAALLALEQPYRPRGTPRP